MCGGSPAVGSHNSSVGSAVASVLSDAVSHGDEEMVAALIAQGLPLMETDIGGWAPVHYAAEHGHTAVLQQLVAELP